jgi:hypothetical protein
MNYAYSPHTGEFINTPTPADWMMTTPIAPPGFDPNLSGCFFKDGSWVIIPSQIGPTPTEVILKQIATLEASVTQRRIREATLGTDNGWLKNVDAEIATLRVSLK